MSDNATATAFDFQAVTLVQEQSRRETVRDFWKLAGDIAGGATPDPAAVSDLLRRAGRSVDDLKKAVALVAARLEIEDRARRFAEKLPALSPAQEAVLKLEGELAEIIHRFEHEKLEPARKRLQSINHELDLLGRDHESELEGRAPWDLETAIVEASRTWQANNAQGSEQRQRLAQEAAERRNRLMGLARSWRPGDFLD